MEESDLELVAGKSLIDDQTTDENHRENCKQMRDSDNSNGWLIENNFSDNISTSYSTVADKELHDMCRIPVPKTVVTNKLKRKLKAQKSKKTHPNVIKVEECSLSDIDHDSPLGKKCIKKYGLHCLQSKDASSDPSPGEPVIVDLDDLSNLNSENDSTKLNTEACNNDIQIDNEYNDSSESELCDDSPDPVSNFLFTNDKVCPSSDGNFTSQRASTSTFDDDQLNVTSLESPSYSQPASNGTNNSETCNNWEISSIFSNLKEYQYPFLDEGNAMQVAQNITPVSFNSSDKTTDSEEIGTDSGVFGMSFYDTRADDFSAIEKSIDSSSLSLDDGSLKSPTCGREINSGYNRDTLFVNKSHTNESNSIVQTSTPNNVHFNTNTCGLVAVNPNFTMQSIPQHVFNNSGEQSPSLNLYQSKSVVTSDDMTLFETSQPQFYYSQYPNYGNYYQHAMENNSAILSNAPLPIADLDHYNPISTQGACWYAPPSTDNVSLEQTFPTNNVDDEETDSAGEFDNIPVTFAKVQAETMSQYFASPQSVASNSCFSNDSSAMHDYSPSPSQTPSACSTPGLVENAPEINADFFSSWHNPVPQTMIPQQIDISKTFCPSIVVPNFTLPLEKRESHMMPFTLPQGLQLKRPFLSMADAMRSSRVSRNKKTLDVKPFVGLDSSIRKSQIQSTKISTSTPKNIKGKKKACNVLKNESFESSADKESGKDERNLNRSRHNEPLNQHAVDIMTTWFYQQVHNPYPTKADKEMMAREGGITENQVKSWFANKRNRTNNTKPKVQKRAMEEKLLEVCKDLKRNGANPLADNSHIIQQLSGIIQHYHSTKQE